MSNKQISEQFISELKQLVLEHLDGIAVKVYLYGSRAKGNARSTSDIDIALLPKTSLPTGCMSRLNEKIERSHIPYHVDIVNLNNTSESFKQAVSKEGKLWKE